MSTPLGLAAPCALPPSTPEAEDEPDFKSASPKGSDRAVHHGIPMSRHRRQRESNSKTLRIFQANVGKIPPAHDCALVLADVEEYEVVILQEPWTETKDCRCLMKTHPAYDTFSLVYHPTQSHDLRSPRDYDVALNMLLQWATTERLPGRLAASSDHFTLSLTPPNFSQVLKQSGKVRLTTDDEVKCFRELVDAGASGLPTATSTPEDLDCLAEGVPYGRELAAHRGGLNNARKPDIQLAKQDFRHVVRRAKRQYWRKLIDSFTDAAQSSKQCDGSQPQGPSNLYLYKSEMQCYSRTPNRDRRPIQSLDTLSPSEIDAVRSDNPAGGSLGRHHRHRQHIPESDNITVKLLQAVWDVTGTHIYRLYEEYLRVGHHAKPF
ncbi:Endonuclease/exonuclease/phosphatase [Metarhizium guizhouense ARSEF 977]|uniref:Endonuclease/exonuclease/phosphatase n=1 Tax=Metarhizium guizhouense (strain ARSEF 977) TaxID=1276136 RepID=A0A0B4HRL0_METGA|nr:Endonuclease/exonuclease/phosphatase [Metarhizium guizhouense ARSEF 977]